MLNKEDSNDTTPPEFICPITKQIMSDPVLLPDGVSYERTAIELYLSKNTTSPKTNEPMKIADAMTNVALKSLIERYFDPEKAQAQTTTTLLQQQEKLDISISAVYEGANIHVQIKPNATEARPETIIVAVVDTSGSMGWNCAQSIPGAENVEISRLQLVQFSMMMIVNSLESRDGLVLIEFESNTREVLKFTQMDEVGKASATKAIDGLSSGGGTNMWDGVKLGVETAHVLETKYPAATVKVMLFTDGEPNSREKPEDVMLAELLPTMPARRFTISTFSYGYSIDSALMDGMAVLGGGVYGYCPDATMVGTIFINFLAQAMNCLVQHVEVEIGGTKMVRSLYIAHAINFLVEGDPKTLEVVVRMAGRGEVKLKGAKAAETQMQREAMMDEVYRKKLIGIVRDNLKDAGAGLAAAKALHSEIKALPAKTPFLSAVMTDLMHADAGHGQVAKAFDTKYYQKWGKDYLRGFARFHELETCGNYKDESLQLYQTAQFGIRRRAINKIFMAMPPLKGRVHSSSSSGQQYQTVGQSSYYDRCGGCWNGDAVVWMWGGEKKRTRELKKGDVLASGAVVRCVVERPGFENGYVKAEGLVAERDENDMVKSLF